MDGDEQVEVHTRAGVGEVPQMVVRFAGEDVDEEADDEVDGGVEVEEVGPLAEGGGGEDTAVEGGDGPASEGKDGEVEGPGNELALRNFILLSAFILLISPETLGVCSLATTLIVELYLLTLRKCSRYSSCCGVEFGPTVCVPLAAIRAALN